MTTSVTTKTVTCSSCGLSFEVAIEAKEDEFLATEFSVVKPFEVMPNHDWDLHFDGTLVITFCWDKVYNA